MANFHTHQKRAKALNHRKVSTDFFNFVRTIETVLADDNAQQLFLDSKDVFGKPIGFYSQGTENITNGRKKAGQPFNLKESGEFLKKLFAKVKGETIIFDTSDSKKNEVLGNLLTTDIFGLSDQDLKVVIDKKMRPFFIKYYKEKLLK